MKQVEDDSFEGEHERNTSSDHSAYTFFALLCFLVAIIFLSIFLNKALDGLSSMLVLLGVIASGFGGIYLLEHRPTRKQVEDEDEEIDFPLSTGQFDERDDSIVEGTVIESAILHGEEEEDENEDEQSLNAFKGLVEDALASIPLEFRERMENLAILVEPEPAQEVLKRVGSKEGYTLLGLYEGTPLTAQSYGGTMLPERITIYQHIIEAYCHGDPERIRNQVRKTVLHEVAHHFGIDHDEMPIWVK